MSIVIFPISIANVKIRNALTYLYLDTSIDNLRIESIMKTLQMVDKTSRKLVKIINDTMIKFENFSFPLDFMLRDIRKDSEIPLILGRPFMKPARMLVDNDKGQVKVKIQDHEICCNILSIT